MPDTDQTLQAEIEPPAEAPADDLDAVLADLSAMTDQVSAGESAPDLAEASPPPASPAEREPESPTLADEPDVTELDAILAESASSPGPEPAEASPPRPPSTSTGSRDLITRTHDPAPPDPLGESPVRRREETPPSDESDESVARPRAVEIALRAAHRAAAIGVGLVVLIDRPFASLDPATKKGIGYAAIGTLVLALVIWVIGGSLLQQ